MATLYEIGQEVMRIREAVNSLEVKGQQNARLIVYCFDKCNGIIQAINDATNRNLAVQNDKSAENVPPDKEGDMNA